MSATLHVPTHDLPPAATPEQIDLSCRWPILLLAAKSGGWLLFASVFGLIASVKMHGPAFLSGSAWLTYGRVYPAANVMFVYGFALPAALAVGLWLLCRLCRTPLIGGGAVMAAAAFWNLGVLWGVFNIFAGNTSGFEGVELSRGSLAILLAAWIAMATAGFLTFLHRREQRPYASVWFVMSALFVFPWIAATACLLLGVAPVRGTVQALVAWWFVANLHWLVLGFIALAAIFYFVPKLSGKALHSHYSALFVFWVVLLFAPWVGVPAGAPVPAWLPSLSGVMSVFLVVAGIAFYHNLRHTLAGPSKLEAGPDKTVFRFFVVAGLCFTLALFLQVFQSVRPFSETLQLTLFTLAQKKLALYGFVAMALLGALFAILPQVTGRPLPAPGMISLNFGVLLAAVAVWAVSLGLGGKAQGDLLIGAEATFMDSVVKSLPYFRVSTLADLGLVLASFAFFWNATGCLCHAGTALCRAALCGEPLASAAKGARA